MAAGALETAPQVPVGLRPPLLWTLIACVMLSAWALWWPDDLSNVVKPADGGAMSAAPLGPQASGNPPDRPNPLPAELYRLKLDPARFDPFVGQAVQVKPSPVQAPAPVLAPIPAPPAPSVPPLLYRYLGRMIGPDGGTSVYLVKGDAVLPIQVGTRLDEGFIVEAVHPGEVSLHYPPLDAHRSIPITLPAENVVR